MQTNTVMNEETYAYIEAVKTYQRAIAKIDETMQHITEYLRRRANEADQ